MVYLSYDEVLEIHHELVDFFQNDGDPIEPAGPRDVALLESACERPKTGLGGTDKYGTVDEKAAALFHSLVANHPFHNGNKRTALVSTVWFLDQNDRRVQAHDDEWFDFVVS
ncbi:type II toxin-antitoxin system death-on-curing family toxin [Halomonas faecis]|uniref:type II toxin-antitoxin system death-on-curing family toxin n=1 Tax=Halomonas faecis TaxID=1562110 RepID=UPI0013D195A3|nr:Fic family protein [Halomonas faecis]